MQYITRRTSTRLLPNERNFVDGDPSLIYLHGRGLINIYLHVSDVVQKTFSGVKSAFGEDLFLNWRSVL